MHTRQTPLMASRHRLVCNILGKYLQKGNHSCLEVGCGVGDFLSILENKDFFSRLKAIDSSIENIRRAQGQAKKSEVLRSDLLDFKEKSDVVIMLEVLEHIKDDREALAHIAKNLLSEDGLFILSVPSNKAVNLPNLGHYRHYDKDKLEDMLIRSGFKVLLFYSYGTKIVNRLGEIILKRRYGLKRENKAMRQLTQESAELEMPVVWRLVLYPLLVNFFYFFYLFDYYFLKDTDRGVGYLVLCQKN